MSVLTYLRGKYMQMQKAIIPSFIYPQTLYEHLLMENVTPTLRWLDIGCGHQLLPEWRLEEEKILVGKCENIVGFDFDIDALRKHRTILNRVQGDISNLPFKDSSFDLITANMVVEHLSMPEVQMREIYRILKPGGRFIIHTPNAWGYVTILSRMIPERVKSRVASVVEGRHENDVYRAYYRLNTQHAIEAHAKSSGFGIIFLRYIVSQAKSNILLPVSLFELLFIRLLMLRPLRKIRANIIAILEK